MSKVTWAGGLLRRWRYRGVSLATRQVPLRLVVFLTVSRTSAAVIGTTYCVLSAMLGQFGTFV